MEASRCRGHRPLACPSQGSASRPAEDARPCLHLDPYDSIASSGMLRPPSLPRGSRLPEQRQRRPVEAPRPAPPPRLPNEPHWPLRALVAVLSAWGLFLPPLPWGAPRDPLPLPCPTPLPASVAPKPGSVLSVSTWEWGSTWGISFPLRRQGPAPIEVGSTGIFPGPDAVTAPGDTPASTFEAGPGHSDRREGTQRSGGPRAAGGRVPTSPALRCAEGGKNPRELTQKPAARTGPPGWRAGEERAGSAPAHRELAGDHPWGPQVRTLGEDLRWGPSLAPADPSRVMPCPESQFQLPAQSGVVGLGGLLSVTQFLQLSNGNILGLW